MVLLNLSSQESEVVFSTCSYDVVFMHKNADKKFRKDM